MRFLLIRPIEESLTLAQKLEALGHCSVTNPVLNDRSGITERA